MVKSKNRQHGLEHIILNNNEDEVWEIDYDYGMAVNVSEYMKMNLVNTEIIKYSGSIKDFLEKERSCSNVQSHGLFVKSFMKQSGPLTAENMPICTFLDTHKSVRTHAYDCSVPIICRHNYSY